MRNHNVSPVQWKLLTSRVAVVLMLPSDIVEIHQRSHGDLAIAVDAIAVSPLDAIVRTGAPIGKPWRATGRS